MKNTHLRQLRKRAGLSQAALADKLGLSTNHVARMEQGTRTITLSMEKLIRLTLGSRS